MYNHTSFKTKHRLEIYLIVMHICIFICNKDYISTIMGEGLSVLQGIINLMR